MKYCDYCGKEITGRRDFCSKEHRRKFFGWTHRDDKPSVILERVDIGRKRGGLNHVYLEMI